MASPRSSTSKEEWRTQFRSYRDALPEATYAAYSTLIAHRALALPEVARAHTVHTYWPVPERGEIDVRPLISALRLRGVEVALPVVTSFDPTTPTLEHRRYAGPSAMQTNRWGLREPTGTERVSPDELDVVVVPALGADRRGTRLGYGMGYYDSFLSDVTCPRVALVYEECLVPALPSDAHDVPMSVVVTERNVHRCSD